MTCWLEDMGIFVASIKQGEGRIPSPAHSEVPTRCQVQETSAFVASVRVLEATRRGARRLNSALSLVLRLCNWVLEYNELSRARHIQKAEATTKLSSRQGSLGPRIAFAPRVLGISTLAILCKEDIKQPSFWRFDLPVRRAHMHTCVNTYVCRILYMPAYTCTYVCVRAVGGLVLE